MFTMDPMLAFSKTDLHLRDTAIFRWRTPSQGVDGVAWAVRQVEDTTEASML
jgi:hypothetical protein